MGQIRKLIIVMAMVAEARPFIESAGLTKLDAPFGNCLPMQAYAGQLDGLAVRLVFNGTDPRFNVDNVATQPAALATYAAIERFKPDIVLNAGTAGAFKDAGLEIGEPVLATGSVSFHDRRIPIPGFDRYGKGGYPCLPAPNMVRALALKTGTISTGNSLDMCPEDLAAIRENRAVIKEMEAAAVAWVAWLMQTPFLAVKTVTDFIDNHESVPEQFDKNLALAVQNLGTCLKQMAAFMNNRDINRL